MLPASEHLPDLTSIAQMAAPLAEVGVSGRVAWSLRVSSFVPRQCDGASLCAVPHKGGSAAPDALRPLVPRCLCPVGARSLH